MEFDSTDANYALRIRNIGNHMFSRAIERQTTRALSPNADDSEKELLASLLKSAGPHDVKNVSVQRRLDRLNMRTALSTSFRALIAQTHDRRKLGAAPASWFLDDKATAYDFVDRLGVPRPHATVTEWAGIEFRPGTILKPVVGSTAQGVYMVFSHQNILHLADGIRFSSLRELESHAKAVMSSPRARLRRTEWIVEDLILHHEDPALPARDLKVYAFYGETPLIREIQRIPTKSSCYWDAEGERVSPTKSKELTLTGDAPSAELLETASRISAAIPAPFIRIDFLRGPDGAYFGEFTPRPGPYWQFNAEWDAALGEAWLKGLFAFQGVEAGPRSGAGVAING